MNGVGLDMLNFDGFPPNHVPMIQVTPAVSRQDCTVYSALVNGTQLEVAVTCVDANGSPARGSFYLAIS